MTIITVAAPIIDLLDTGVFTPDRAAAYADSWRVAHSLFEHHHSPL